MPLESDSLKISQRISHKKWRINAPFIPLWFRELAAWRIRIVCDVTKSYFFNIFKVCALTRIYILVSSTLTIIEPFILAAICIKDRDIITITSIDRVVATSDVEGIVTIARINFIITAIEFEFVLAYSTFDFILTCVNIVCVVSTTIFRKIVTSNLLFPDSSRARLSPPFKA
jgi:hypothetical protein